MAELQKSILVPLVSRQVEKSRDVIPPLASPLQFLFKRQQCIFLGLALSKVGQIVTDLCFLMWCYIRKGRNKAKQSLVGRCI